MNGTRGQWVKSVAIMGQWVKSGDVVAVHEKRTGEVFEVVATSDPYYDNEDRSDVINVESDYGYAKWNVSRGRWEC